MFNREEKISLGKDLTYTLKIFDFQYRFIMPPRLEFSKGIDENGKVLYGIISYSEAERLLGVFRFPQESDGFFASPIAFTKIVDDVIQLSPEQLQDLINRKKVLTFEAFRIPFFGFEFFYITESDFEEIKKLAGDDFTKRLRSSYEKEIASRYDDVKNKITALPNILLILQNVLDLRWKNENEISVMTGGILHYGI
jgi:hypothetical protein